MKKNSRILFGILFANKFYILYFVNLDSEVCNAQKEVCDAQEEECNAQEEICDAQEEVCDAKEEVCNAQEEVCDSHCEANISRFYRLTKQEWYRNFKIVSK